MPVKLIVPRTITVNDASAGLQITQSGAGALLKLATGAGVKATFNANGLRVGDATAPTKALESANGLTVAAGITRIVGQFDVDADLAFVGNQAIRTQVWADNVYVALTAHNNLSYGEGGAQVEVARLESDNEPRFCHTKPINMRGGGLTGATIAQATITATDISFDQASKTITTVGEDFGDLDLAVDDTFTISGTDFNDGTYTVASQTTTTIVTDEALTDEAAGDTVVVTASLGKITITAGEHTVFTQAEAASDNLDVIKGGREGDIIILRPAHAARDIVVKHNGARILLAGGADFTMDELSDILVLYAISATLWFEISRSENHA